MTFRPSFSVIGVVGAALVVRLLAVLVLPSVQYSDSVWYDTAAHNLAFHGLYGVDGPSAWFPPGYPFFLSLFYRLFGGDQIVGKLANVLLGAGTCLLAYLVGRDFFGRKAGLIAAGLLGLWPNLVAHTLILSSDVLATFQFVLCVWLAERVTSPARGRRLTVVLLGLALGWTVLTRPVGVILFPTIALLWWIRNRSLRATAMRLAPLVLLSATLLGLWTVRNFVQFGQPILISTNGGYNFWQGNQPYADGDDTYWSQVPKDDPEYQTMQNGDEFTKNREGYRYAFAYLEAHPGQFFALAPTKAFLLYSTDTSGVEEALPGALPQAPPLVSQWFYAHWERTLSLAFRYYEAVVVLACVTAAASLVFAQARRGSVLVVASLPLFLTLFQVAFYAKDRFHLPVLPSFALLAGYGLAVAFSYGYRAARSWRRVQEPTLLAGPPPSPSSSAPG